MTYGFVANSNNGQLLISSDYPVYSYLGAATQGASVTNRNLTSRTYSIPYNSSSPPVVFIQLDVGDYASVQQFTQSGSNWTFTVAGNIRNTTSKIRCYGLAQNRTSTGYGLQVFNSSGQVMFDSSQNPLWANDFFSFPGSTVLTGPNFSQINGTLSSSYIQPIYLCNMLFAGGTPSVASTFGIKRTGTSTWTSTQWNDTSEPRTIVASVTLYDVGILVCEGVL